LAAVNWIAQDSSSTPYVVLADQQVSVGALWTSAFRIISKMIFIFIPSRPAARLSNLSRYGL